jgi:hypothetical protein
MFMQWVEEVVPETEGGGAEDNPSKFVDTLTSDKSISKSTHGAESLNATSDSDSDASDTSTTPSSIGELDGSGAEASEVLTCH